MLFAQAHPKKENEPYSHYPNSAKWKSSKHKGHTMQTKPSKFWAYIAVIVGIFLLLSGLGAAIGYFGLPLFFSFGEALSYELGNIAALYLGLFGGALAVYHGMSSISNRKSSKLKLPFFYVFWIILGLVLGLGTLIINNNIAI